MDELNISERINLYMGRLGMTNKDLATRMGISERHLVDCKRDPERMRYGEIKKLCRVINIPVEKLLEGR